MLHTNRDLSIDVLSGCGGFVRNYKSICNSHGTPVNQTIIDDLENIFFKNGIREFILGDFLSNTVCRRFVIFANHAGKIPKPRFRGINGCLST